jgi:predicted nucleic acid-binding Zn finger protein
MTTQEVQKRQARAESLKVLKSEDGQYFVESSNGKILYHVPRHKDNFVCTCGDYSHNIKLDAEFKCKHILAVLNSEDGEPVKYLDKHRPQLDERFIIDIRGKEFVLYAGVLDLATQMGLVKLEVDLIQVPSDQNKMVAVCKATAVSKTGAVFIDYGDANPMNCTEKVSRHIIRVASTRAKGRALRDMCNIGIACLEELGDFEDEIPADKKPRTAKAPPRKTADNKPAEQKTPAKALHPVDNKPVSNGPMISEAQKRAIYNLGKRKKMEEQQIDKMIMDRFGLQVDSLSSAVAGTLIQELQAA